MNRVAKKRPVFILAAVVSGVAGQCFESLSPEASKQAHANWNATMAAYRSRVSASTGTCASDLRKSLPACLQYEEDWCWATALAELASFFKPHDFPVRGSDCHGVECKIAGYKRDPKHPEACCNGTATKFCRAYGSVGGTCCESRFPKQASCLKKCGFFSHEVDDVLCQTQECDIGGNYDDITNGIMRLTGMNYTTNDNAGPPSVERLDAILSKGRPMVIVVMWDAGGGHALTLAGCAAAGGPYYLHDPKDAAGAYRTLTYEEIAEYRPSWDRTAKGSWFWSWWHAGDEVTASDELIV